MILHETIPKFPMRGWQQLLVIVMKMLGKIPNLLNFLKKKNSEPYLYIVLVFFIMGDNNQ